MSLALALAIAIASCGCMLSAGKVAEKVGLDWIALGLDKAKDWIGIGGI